MNVKAQAVRSAEEKVIILLESGMMANNRKRNRQSVRVRDNSTVASYEHFVELKNCLASGWPSTTTREYLIEKNGPDRVPSEIAIQRWRTKHMANSAMVLPPQIIRDKLKGIDFKVDVISHLSRLIALCEDRVARGLNQEDSLFGGMPLAINDAVMGTYLHALAQYVQVAQDLGILKFRPQVPLIDARSVNMSPEALVALRETVREIKMIEQGGQDAGLGRAETGDKEDDQKAEDIQDSP